MIPTIIDHRFRAYQRTYILVRRAKQMDVARACPHFPSLLRKAHPRPFRRYLLSQ